MPLGNSAPSLSCHNVSLNYDVNCLIKSQYVSFDCGMVACVYRAECQPVRCNELHVTCMKLAATWL